RRAADLCGGPQGQSGPGVEQAKHFSYDIQGIAGASPPVIGVEGVVRNSVDDSLAVGTRKLFPESASAARVDFGGHEDYATRGCAGKSLADGGHLIGGIDDGRLQDMNGGFADTFVDKDELVVNVFPLVGHGEFCEACPRLRGMSQPDLGRVSLLVLFGGFQGPGGQVTARVCDGGPVLQGIFGDKPATQMEEDEKTSTDHAEGQNRPKTRLSS